MNKLKPEKQEMVLNLLVEGNSLRGIQRITGTNRRTIIRLIRETGKKCEEYMARYFRDLNCQYIECDEIWTYVAKKQARLRPNEKNDDIGDQFVFVALDRDTKLVPAFIIGKRNGETATVFMRELKNRVANRFQLTTDRFKGYFEAVDWVFGADIDYATIHKNYHSKGNGKREGYSPSILKRINIRKIIGNPDREKICTSYVERQNLTMRTYMKRFNRLTIAFSKKLDCLKAMVAIYFWYYNFMRIHNSLRVTPAMEAGIVPTFLTWKEVLS